MKKIKMEHLRLWLIPLKEGPAMLTRLVPTGTASEDGSPCCESDVPTRLAVSPWAVVISTLGALLMPSVAFAATLKEVSALGKQVGTLNVSTYDAEKTADGNFARAVITTDFTKDGSNSDGKNILKQSAPDGLTFMQTMTFTTDKQQEFFQRPDGGSLLSTFSDPSQGGYGPPVEPIFGFANDKTPWYSNLKPSGEAGDVPPDKFFEPYQFADIPTISFSDYSSSVDGLADVLNGKDGMWNFETALVGVSKQPTEDKRLTGIYEVVPFQTFTWGLEFEYVNDGISGFTADDYTVTAKDLAFRDGPSDAFIGAFDQMGDNADAEWQVNFVKPVAEPSSILGPLAAGSLGLRLLWKKRQRATTK